MKDDLRKLAEAKAATLSPEEEEKSLPREMQQILHELRVHQIELEMQNEELRKAQTETEFGRARYFDLYNAAPVGYVTVSEQGLILDANRTAATLLGVNRDAMVQQPLTHFILKADQDTYYLFRKNLSSPCSEQAGQADATQTCELRLAKSDGGVCWARLDATATEGPDGERACRVVLSDITERKRAEESLKKIEWMLSGESILCCEAQAEPHDQGYGDLTELNRDGIILKSIGLDRLKILADAYLELLGTSSAIYEVNGDYAYGIFSSGWCRMMDCASRKLCDTSDNVQALNSGCWLCHESCWTDCGKEAVAQCVPMDIECNGGLRMYAVPIQANGKVVGVINFGYGDPPTDSETLQKLATTYHLAFEDLLRETKAYDSRPPFIIELAKKRLHATARIIGSMIETKQAEEALRRRIEYEQLLHEASTMALAADDLAEFRELCLALIGEKIGVDRAYFFRHNEATDTMDNTHEWCAEGIEPQQEKLQGIPASAIPWWLQSMRRHETICYQDIEDIPDETMKQILRPQNIKSILAVPLFINGQYYGFLGLDDCAHYRDWRQVSAPV